MLKRSKLLIALLVVTVVCASIGFAAVSDSLSANGTWNMTLGGSDDPFQEEFAADVYFTNAVLGTGTVSSATTTGDAPTVVLSIDDDNSETDDKLNITINNGAFTAPNQKIIVEATIVNASTTTDAKVTVGEINKTAVSAFANVEASVSNNGDIAKGGENTVTLTITITLNSIPATDLNGVTFSVPVTAVAAN